MVLRGVIAITLAVAALATGGCGDDSTTVVGTAENEATRPATTPTATGEQWKAGSAVLVFVEFTEDGMSADGPLEVAAGASVSLTVASRDGRPHGLTVEGAPGEPRVVVLPGKSKALDLGVLPAGRYRLAPDGAGEPLVLVVE